ncbi:MAG: hypothetical protein H6621_02135 [Halobacteriovoraceae bacterium]|nr:hypothetical protein [Halobacteriovoraceae bacterium]MCB9093842.1 hypothetical protein [Halobacteriovoraceae bacterium]
MKLIIMTLGLAFLFTTSCSSTKSKEMKKVEDVDISENIERDYKVRDASTNMRPGWIVDAGVWAEKQSYDVNKYKFFSYETEPKVSREMACNLAKANVKSDIAGEITTFIQKKLGASEEGVATIDPNNPMTQPLRSYVENSLVEKVQAIIVGASIEKTYWEKREFKKDLGAKRDYFGYTCATLAKIDRETISKSIDQVRMDMMNKTQSSELKAKVEKALEDADNDFMKMRGL